MRQRVFRGSHEPLAQSESTAQSSPSPHGGHSAPPQSTPVSFALSTPSTQLAAGVADTVEFFASHV